jgi:HD-GYP domain-containing protein (c-di-GMP phosphodiesterase class II)
MNVAQTMEVFADRSGPRAAVRAVVERSGRWFDPEVVRAARSLEHDHNLWQQMRGAAAREQVLKMEPGIALPVSPERIDCICQGFAQVIDAKSPYTFRHSVGVAAASSLIAEQLSLAPATCTVIRRAALLHDLGKLGVSNAILEKPGRLTPQEWEIMRIHPAHTRTILANISGFEHLAYIAGAHHERLDGTGYPQGLTAGQMSLPARIIAVADVYQALSEKRPYREGLPPEVVFEIMDRDVPAKLDADCLAVLKACGQELGEPRKTAAHAAGR